MEGFLTWELLATFTGATAGTALVTEFIKRRVPAVKGGLIHLVSYFVALSALVLGSLFTGTLDASSGALCVFNAFAVSVAANGSYDNASTFIGSLMSK